MSGGGWIHASDLRAAGGVNPPLQYTVVPVAYGVLSLERVRLQATPFGQRADTRSVCTYCNEAFYSSIALVSVLHQSQM